MTTKNQELRLWYTGEDYYLFETRAALNQHLLDNCCYSMDMLEDVKEIKGSLRLCVSDPEVGEPIKYETKTVAEWAVENGSGWLAGDIW